MSKEIIEYREIIDVDSTVIIAHKRNVVAVREIQEAKPRFIAISEWEEVSPIHEMASTWPL